MLVFVAPLTQDRSFAAWAFYGGIRAQCGESFARSEAPPAHIAPLDAAGTRRMPGAFMYDSSNELSIQPSATGGTTRREPNPLVIKLRVPARKESTHDSGLDHSARLTEKRAKPSAAGGTKRLKPELLVMKRRMRSRNQPTREEPEPATRLKIPGIPEGNTPYTLPTGDDSDKPPRVTVQWQKLARDLGLPVEYILPTIEGCSAACQIAHDCGNYKPSSSKDACQHVSDYLMEEFGKGPHTGKGRSCPWKGCEKNKGRWTKENLRHHLTRGVWHFAANQVRCRWCDLVERRPEAIRSHLEKGECGPLVHALEQLDKKVEVVEEEAV
ncbi:hypothetical protein BD626DRAFT_516435 [Schizophyllum amplum]|uniref:Uncharacterized protein n=1 Tax=Schizophyllum amplum TaxID=97359 RepID=A0A550BX35_9AGAR|nr:hypothetical protein BD626DRAFT_516435 [Auriculariopsis ampla]